MINLSTDEMEDDQMDKNEKLVSIIIPISVALIFSLICGIGFYFFWGSFNLFGEQGFHHDSGLSGARWGVCLGIFGFSPLVITGVFALFKYKRQAKISLMIMIAIYACWSVIILAVSSYQNKKTIQYHQLATSTEIAERSIKRAKEGPVSPDRTRFIEYLGTNIWINEFTPTSYGGDMSIVKVKEIIEETSRLVLEDDEITPRPVNYGWREYTSADSKTYAMCMFYDDSTYTVLYELFPEQKEEWDDSDIPMPVKLEDDLKRRYG